MKISSSSLFGLTLFPLLHVTVPAFAQASSVTFYGQTDIALHYANNENSDEKSVLKLGNSGIFSNKIGFKGEEDLGDGNRAFFQLESGFKLDTGAMASQSPAAGRTNLFGRQSAVGLKGNWGELSAGRQYNALSVLYEFQPVGDHFFVSGDNFFSGYRLDNSVIYKKQLGDFKLQLDYGFGEQSGSLARKSSVGANLQYKRGDFHSAIAYLQNRSIDGSTIGRYANIGASYAMTPLLTLSGGYARNVESGGSRRKRGIAFASLGYKFTPSWSGYASYYYYRQSDCQGSCGKKPGDPNNVSGGIDTAMAGYAISPDKGRANVLTLITTYALSKRTMLYGETDWLLARDGAARDHNYANTAQDKQLKTLRQNHVMVGIKHAF